MEELSTKIDDISKNIDTMKELLKFFNKNIEENNNKLDSLDKRINSVENKLNHDILQQCNKMGNHIDFVEEVYENVKHPLGYICKKIKYITTSENVKYSLLDKK